MSRNGRCFTVVDLFSGAGGMSYGFLKHPRFDIVAAADAEYGKPSTGKGRLQCNRTYCRNVGISPAGLDLGRVAPDDLRKLLGLKDTKVDVLSTCPPCTGFSRANPDNHLRDDHRNSLVRKSAEFALALDADVIVMENARELIQGNFTGHFEWFREHLQEHGYDVHGRPYILTRFGLPQLRERAIVIAVKRTYPMRTLDDLWHGWLVSSSAITVRRAFTSIASGAQGRNAYPRFSSSVVRARIAAIPKDGGSWSDLLLRPDADSLMTNAMKKIVASGRFGSYPDVYGRLAWDKPAPTIKRECAHIGNGRYAHPVEDRLCSVREMAILQGFPNDFVFDGAALSNIYRHIGDAVPPLVSYQLAHVCAWILTGVRPSMQDVVLEGASLRGADIRAVERQELLYA